MRAHHPIDRNSTSWKAALAWLGLRLAVGGAALAVALALGGQGTPEHARTAEVAQASAAR